MLEQNLKNMMQKRKKENKKIFSGNYFAEC